MCVCVCVCVCVFVCVCIYNTIIHSSSIQCSILYIYIPTKALCYMNSQLLAYLSI